MRAQVLSHVQLCKPMDCSLPGSSVHGILQARKLGSVAKLRAQTHYDYSD